MSLSGHVLFASPFIFQAYHVITLEGGIDEGELDDLDFSVEALPIAGGIDPGPGSGKAH